jgi:Flp pilus assembly protein TadD
MQIDVELLKLLMEMGFRAANTGRWEEAAAMFGGVNQARPDSAFPHIGLGCVAMGRGDFSKAVTVLRNAPANAPGERELCNGFMGLALRLDGHMDESREVLTQLMNEGENEVAVRMAGKLLEQS